MSKIYNEVLIDMNPESSGYGETIYEDSFEHEGPIEMKMDGDEYIRYDSQGNEYKVEYVMGAFKEADSFKMYKNGEEVNNFEGGWDYDNWKVSELKTMVDGWATGSTKVDWDDDPYTASGDTYKTLEDAYYSTQGGKPDWIDSDEAPTFKDLYSGQGTDMADDWAGPRMDITKSWAMDKFDLSSDEFDTVTPLSMKPLDDINQKFQTDVGDFSNALRDTNVSLNEQIGGVQSVGGFAGDSGAITQPFDYKKDLTESSATSAYSAISKGRFSDIDSTSTTMYDKYLADLVEAGK